MNNLVLKNFRAILAGFLLVVILSILTDFVLEKANLMKQPFDQNPSWLIIFVVLYRSLFAIFGAYLTAKLAPRRPMRLAMVGGAIGFIISLAGAIIMWNTPPKWYPVSLVLTTLPCAWLGGRIYLNRITPPEKKRQQ